MRKKVKEAFFWFVDLPTWVHALVGAVSVMMFYLAIFLPAKGVVFSYAGENCVNKFTLFPTLHKTRDDSYFDVKHENYNQIGNIPIFSSSSCVTPKQAPQPGVTKVSSSPWGGLFAKKDFAITVPAPPTANLSIFSKPIPATKSVKIPLTQTDTLHEYELVVGEESITCDPLQNSVLCDITELELEQGSEYDFELVREFSGQKLRVSEGELETLPAVEITKTSVKQGEKVYSNPTKFEIETNKELKSAKGTLSYKIGEESETVEGSINVEGNKIVVTAKAELPRPSDYTLTITSVESFDGSSLADEFKLNFSLSGGPEIKSVSANTVRVNPNEKIVLTFDQALADNTNPSDYLTFTGGEASLSKTAEDKITVSLKGLPKCQSFSIKVKEGLKSKYDVASTEAWSFTGRTTCHSLSSIGASRQGRAIYAYSFGSSGPVTMFVGGLHGNESSSKKLLNRWIDELEANPTRYANKRVVIVPGVNADGLAAGTRNNSNNVDLNRNFPTADWQKDTESKNGVIEGAGGEEPLSEPEAKALADYVTKMSPRLLLSYHAVGGVVLGDVGMSSATYAQKYSSLSGYRDTTGQSSQDTFSYNVTGSFEEWTVEQRGIPSMIVELGGYSSFNFATHRDAMWAMLD